MTPAEAETFGVSEAERPPAHPLGSGNLGNGNDAYPDVDEAQTV